ncbi:MAG: NAD(P)H-binding protein [Actinobacteria bacterium]|nr:NAD(P)H-binding protein [Actinomycetota bacterium]
MRVAILGASGTIGSQLVREALDRGHSVIAVVRRPEAAEGLPAAAEVRLADVDDPAALRAAVAGAEAVITALGGGASGRPQLVAEAAPVLLAELAAAGVPRLLVVGGAGSLEDEPGKQLVDSPEFPAAWRPGSLAQRDALDVYRAYQGPLEWTYLSPADVIEPGERTGSYELGEDRPVRDAAGNSRISVADYAVAMIDELEQPRFSGTRFTVGYA